MGSPTISAVTAVGVLFCVIAIFCLGVRIYSNRRYQKSIELDDWLIAPAFLLTIAAGVAMIVGAQLNVVGGHSLPMITPEQNARVGEFEYAFWMGHVLTICFIKLSILLFFRRLFRGRTKRTAFDVVNWTLIGLVISWTIAFIFCDAFACRLDPAATWTTKYWLHDQCFDIPAMMLASSASNWILDLAILVEPLVMVGKLHLNTGRKLQLSAMFLFSAFAVVAGLLRVIIWIGVYTHGMENVEFFDVVLSTGDVQAVAAYCLFWTWIEIGVGFMVACLLPAAKVLDAISITALLSKIRSMSSSIFTRSRRSGSLAEENDLEANSVSSWSLHEQLRKSNNMRHYDDELARISRLASTMDRSGYHSKSGHQSVIKGGEAESQLAEEY